MSKFEKEIQEFLSKGNTIEVLPAQRKRSSNSMHPRTKGAVRIFNQRFMTSVGQKIDGIPK